uniref:Uncharacterized protein n=1 Tax=Macaca fascicularis TaxID=9541 RepID=A0A7N9D9A4_MACFA
MSRHKSAAGVEPSWRTSTREVQRGNVELELPHRVPIGAQPSGAMRRKPLSYSPQNGGSTDSLHYAPGKATGTQCQPAHESSQGGYTLQSHSGGDVQGLGSPFLASVWSECETWSQRRLF